MKKTYAILFLLAVFTSQLGHYFIFAFEQWQIRNEVKRELIAGLPDNVLEIFSMDDEGIKWEEEGKEFSFQGAMYDVVRMKKYNGKTFLYCLNDKKEKQLRKTLASAIKENSSRSNKSNKQTVKLQLTAFIILQKQPEFSIQYNRSLYSWIDVNFHSNIQDINDPPPKA